MEQNNEHIQETRHRSGKKTLIFGLLVIAFGFSWLMHNFGWISEAAWDVIFTWQMLLIAIGVVNVVNDSHRGFGWILIFIGGFFLVSDIYNLPFTFTRAFWPALLIIVGLFLIFGTRNLFRRKEIQVSTGEDFIEEVSIFSGKERRVNSKAFRGGKIVSIFGGSEIDLSQVTLAPGEVMIESVSIFGGTTIIVPSDWNVKIEVFNIFGGYGDKRFRTEVDYNKTVVIKGVAIFGGGELKSI